MKSAKLFGYDVREPSPVSGLPSPVSRFLFPVFRLLAPISCLQSPVFLAPPASCLPPPVCGYLSSIFRLLSNISCLPYHVSRLTSPVCLMSPVSRLLPYFSCPVSRPLSHISRAVSPANLIDNNRFSGFCISMEPISGLGQISGLLML